VEAERLVEAGGLQRGTEPADLARRTVRSGSPRGHRRRVPRRRAPVLQPPVGESPGGARVGHRPGDPSSGRSMALGAALRACRHPSGRGV